MGIVQGRSHHFRSEVDRNLTRIYIFINMFFKEVSSVHRSCIYLIQNAADAVILWKYFTKSYCFLFEHILKCNSASLLQSSVLHDSSEIILIYCSRNFFNYHDCQYLKQLNTFFQDSLMNKRIVSVTYVTLVPWRRERRRHVGGPTNWDIA